VETRNTSQDGRTASVHTAREQRTASVHTAREQRTASVHTAREQRTSLSEGRSLIIDYVCCGIYGVEQKCIQGFGEERDHFQHFGVHARIILKWI
jgi:hypothetical protein